MALHSLYELTLQSNIDIDGLPHAAEGAHADLEIVFAPFADRKALRERATPLHEAFPMGPDRRPLFILCALGDDYLFHFPDGVQYIVNSGGTHLAASWPPDLDAQIAATYLVSVVMAFVLRLRGHDVLHASTALIGGEAIAFIGPSGSGKSTIAACLARRGVKVISDDVTALVDHGDRFDVLSSYPRLRLWSDSASLIDDALPFIAGEEWKRYLELNDAFASGSFPLRAIYSFEDRVGDPRAPRIEPLAGRDALVDLLANSFKYSPGLAPSAASFERLGRVAQFVPMRLIVPHQDLASAWKLADLVVADRVAADAASGYPRSGASSSRVD